MLDSNDRWFAGSSGVVLGEGHGRLERVADLSSIPFEGLVVEPPILLDQLLLCLYWGFAPVYPLLVVFADPPEVCLEDLECLLTVEGRIVQAEMDAIVKSLINNTNTVCGQDEYSFVVLEYSEEYCIIVVIMNTWSYDGWHGTATLT